MNQSYSYLLGVVLAISSLFSLAGCSDNDTAGQQVPGHGDDSGVHRELVLLTWDEYLSESVIEQFEAEFGVAVDYQTFENTIECKAIMQSSPGAFDLVIADDVTLRELAELKRLAPLDRSALPNFGNLDDRYLDLQPDPGNVFTVPYLWGTTLMAYRTDLIGDLEPTWKNFFATDHGLPVAMLDEMVDAFACSLLAAGHSLNSGEVHELKDAEALLRQFADHGDVMVEELFTCLDALDAGEVVMAMTFSGDAALYAEENELIDYVIPEEGAPLWLDSLAVPADAPHRDNAFAFIDFILRPDVAAQNATDLWYATPNREAVALIDPELHGDKAIWPDHEILQRCEFHAEAGAERDLVLSKGMKYVMHQVRLKQQKKTVSDAAGSGNSGNRLTGD